MPDLVKKILEVAITELPEPRDKPEDATKAEDKKPDEDEAKDSKERAAADQPHPSAVAGPWQHAIGRFTATAKWITAAFSAVFLAALGTSPFLVFDGVDTPGELAWTAWGLAAAVVGYFAIVRRLAALQTPVNISLGRLFRAREDSKEPVLKHFMDELALDMEALRASGSEPENQDWFALSGEQIERGQVNLGWRQQASPEDFLEWIVALERQRWELDRLVEASLLDPETPKSVVASRIKARDRIHTLIVETAWALGNWTDRAAYWLVRDRFVRSVPHLFLSAGIVTAGVLAFVGSSRLEVGSGEQQIIAIDPELVDLNAASGGTFPSSCLPPDGAPLTGSVIDGSGTPDSPMFLRLDRSSSCPVPPVLAIENPQSVVAAAWNQASPDFDGDRFHLPLARLFAPDSVLFANLVAWAALLGVTALLILGDGKRPWKLAPLGLGTLAIALGVALVVPMSKAVGELGAVSIGVWALLPLLPATLGVLGFCRESAGPG